MEKTKRRLKEGEIIPIKEDYIFTEIFNKEENKYVLENFLSAYLYKRIEDIRGNVKILSRNLKKENISQARNEVDILLVLGEEVYNIELNNRKEIERNVVYASKVHGRNIRQGDKEYYSMNKTIQINLNNYRSNKEKLIESYYLRNEEGEKLTEKLQIDQIDMVKAREMCYSENEREEKIRKWCMAINAKTEKELEYYLGDLMSKKDKEKLVEEIKEMSVEEQYADIYIEAELYTPRREMAINTEIAEAKDIARKEGLAEGRAEGLAEGLAEGREEGIKEGIEQGKVEGVAKRNIEIAKNMLKDNVDINLITKYTGISIEDINKIK